MADLILEYLKEIEKETSRGVAPEHTYRPALKKLVESFDNGIVAVNEPKRIACGAPDYLISRRNLTLGTRYADFLKIDFPRVPLTSDKTLFAALVKLGGELSALHLMESPELSKTSVAFPVAGNSEVEKGFPKFNVDEASSLVPQQPRVSVDQTRQDASSLNPLDNS